MYAHATDGSQPNNKQFSPCSRKLMGDIIKLKQGLVLEWKGGGGGCSLGGLLFGCSIGDLHGALRGRWGGGGVVFASHFYWELYCSGYTLQVDRVIT